jgi:hypothetical protein
LVDVLLDPNRVARVDMETQLLINEVRRLRSVIAAAPDPRGGHDWMARYISWYFRILPKTSPR